MPRNIFLLISLLLFGASCGDSSDPTVPVVSVTEAGPVLSVSEAKIGLPAGSSAALYFVLENAGDQDATLTGISVSIASMSMLHEIITEDGLSKMSPIEGGVIVPAGGSVIFEPGAKHGMLMGMAEVTEGEQIEVQFEFVEVETITANAEVVSLMSLSE